ncbi:MAG: type II toxin-antitoxin system RelE/ParE family toxin [Methylomonas sp.]|nr:type II toxin-antitoxin system RelE/ParE family toxin [Methylomonas sp.]
MPAVIFSRAAVRDLDRVVTFLEEKNPKAALDAKERIIELLELLQRHPLAGRSIRENPATRNIVTGYGKSGYVFRYRIDSAGNIVILRIWHGREDRP